MMTHIKSQPEFAKRKVGLALSGGSAKGVAHIGVIKALIEANVPIDYIAGTSMGALVGAFYATRGDIAEAETFACSVNRRHILQLIGLPLLTRGVIKARGKKVNEFFARYFGDTTFEQCRIPIRMVATDIETNEPIILKQGKLLPAIRASIALPRLFKPVILEDGMLLADGGLSIPLPVSVAHQMGADVVIAVDVLGADHRELAAEELQHADIVIRPDLDTLGSDHYDRARQLIDLGRDATQRALPDIEALLR